MPGSPKDEANQERSLSQNSNERKHHGYTSGPSGGEELPEPSYGERARTLLTRAREGTLATVLARHAGHPFASLMPYALDDQGRPVVLTSSMAVHTQNLARDPRGSLLVSEPDSESRNPLGLARVTLVGSFQDVPKEGGDARDLYLERHPDARYWVDYPDFGFRRMEVEEAYYVGGFGVMGWVAGEEYREAEPDPLREAARSIIEHVNEDHADALLLLSRWKGVEDAREAVMTSVDRLGYQLRVQGEERVQGLRIPFPEEARTSQRVREMMVEQVRRAREALEG